MHFYHRARERISPDMTEFMIRFLVSNLYISIVILLLLFIKKMLKNTLSARSQYHVWFLVLALLSFPVAPLDLTGLGQLLPLFFRLHNDSLPGPEKLTAKDGLCSAQKTQSPLYDLTLSVSQATPSRVGLILCVIWIIGIFFMICLFIRSLFHLYILKNASLPIQNKEFDMLYQNCLHELRIPAGPSVYGTAILRSPVITGLLRPCIYLPQPLLSDFRDIDMRYILLHELQHFKHKDSLINYWMNIISIIYWFNPIVRYGLKIMRIDREVACDAFVLSQLEETEYESYGNTLINYAEKVSFDSFFFRTGISGSMKQMRKRVLHIAAYQKPDLMKKVKSTVVFLMIFAVLLRICPILSTYAADDGRYRWNPSCENISVIDLSAYFNGYEGSFVLYDPANAQWHIYNMDAALARTAPDSTYKIYDALFALEAGIITPEHSYIAWNNEVYPFSAWNAGQTLRSAMSSSVNWYFQALDQQLGRPRLYACLQEISYGNERLTGGLSSYWLESTLKISPIEQVELLKKLYDNRFPFAPENIQAVKDSIFLTASENGQIYGKTGTGRVNGHNINGWFIGWIETAGQTYFFVANIKADNKADGSTAAQITFSILSDMGVYPSTIRY